LKERRKTKKNLFCNFVWNNHPLGWIPQREKEKRKKENVANQKYIRVCLKESFHREKKD
jgi:hypothetical protein